MDAILKFDPLKSVEEIVVIVAITAAFSAAWVYKARILQAVTGDDRFHIDCLDMVWYSCCQGCGLCTGEWTRCLTMMTCCPKRLRGANLVRVIGQCFGLTPYTVEIKNIVAGDLPYRGSHGDFYLHIANAANPAMMSSLAEEKHPKVVHFPEVMTIRLRWSHLEESLRITIKELNILGSSDVCYCQVDPIQILEWSEQPNERIKRFEMKPFDTSVVSDTPAWILLEFDKPSEARDLESLQGISSVRTSTRDGHYIDTPLDRFKRDYMLLDANGNAMDEIPEEDLREISRMRAFASAGYWFCNLVTVTVVVSYCLLRAYVWSCHREFRWLTMAYMQGEVFPIKPHRLKRIAKKCDLQVQRDGAELGTPCRPTPKDVLGLCHRNATGGHLPDVQPRPTAFGHFATTRLGLPSGVPCADHICVFRNNLVKLDFACVVGCLGLIAANCCFHFCMQTLMQQRKNGKTRERLERSRKAQEQVDATRRGGLFS